MAERDHHTDRKRKKKPAKTARLHLEMDHKQIQIQVTESTVVWCVNFTLRSVTPMIYVN